MAIRADGAPVRTSCPEERSPDDPAFEVNAAHESTVLTLALRREFRRCPLRWWFKNVRKLPESFVTSSQLFNDVVEETIRFHFSEFLSKGAAPTWQTLADRFESAWRTEQRCRAIRYATGESFEDVVRCAESVFRTFCFSEFARPAGRIVEVARSLQGSVGETSIETLIDLIVDDGEGLLLSVVRVSCSRWADWQLQEHSEELLLASELARTLAHDRPLRLEFLVVTKTKTPAIDRFPVAVDAEQVQRAHRVVQRVWEAMQSGVVYPSPSPINCPGCPYREPCRRWCG